jgi:hypothetical protein
MTLLDHLDARLAYTRELDGEQLDVYELASVRDALWVTAASEDETADACRLGVRVGEFAVTGDLFDVLESWRDRAGSPRTYAEAVRLGQAELWLVVDTSSGALSLDLIESTIGTLTSEAEELRRALVGHPAREQAGMAHEWQRAEGSIVVDNAARSLVRRGHKDAWPWWLFGTGEANGIERSGEAAFSHWYIGDHLWLAPMLRDELPETAMMFLQRRFAPDCVDLTFEGERVLVAGAVGWVAFAVEDRATFTNGLVRRFAGVRGDTLLDVVARSLPLAAKMVEGPQRVMPHSDFGWQRPLCFTGSAIRKQAEVALYSLQSREFEVCEELTELWRSVVQNPSSEEALDGLLHGVERHMERWLQP